MIRRIRKVRRNANVCSVWKSISQRKKEEGEEEITNQLWLETQLKEWKAEILIKETGWGEGRRLRGGKIGCRK